MRFASLSVRNISYLVETGNDMDFSSHTRACDWAKQYDTYGDGMTQHSNSYAVPLANLGDFLASLATYLLSADATEKDHETIAGKWPHQHYDITKQKVMFLQGIRPKEGKKVYYNPGDCKTSTSESKRHDKRWYEVPDWADGTIETIYALAFTTNLRTDYHDTLTKYAIFDYIRSTVAEATDHYGTRPQDWLKIEDRHFYQAFSAVQALALAWRERNNGRKQLDCYITNSGFNRKEQAQAA